MIYKNVSSIVFAELNTKETAVEVYRLPKQAWARELESARPANLALGTLVPGFQPPPEPQAASNGTEAADVKLAVPEAGEQLETSKDISDIGILVHVRDIAIGNQSYCIVICLSTVRITDLRVHAEGRDILRRE